MADTHVKPIVAAAAVCGLVAVVIHVTQQGPVSSDARGTTGFMGLLYDFQTLIGGALALCAAWWTVATMEKTDQAAALRHEEQIGLSLRADRLAVERAIHPQMRSLHSLREQMIRLRQRLLSNKTFEEQLLDITLRAESVNQVFRDLKEVLERKQLRDGTKLFDGQLTYKLHWMHSRALGTVEVLTPICAESNLGRRMKMGDDERDNIIHIYSAIMQMIVEIPVVNEMMAQTGARYGVTQQ